MTSMIICGISIILLFAASSILHAADVSKKAELRWEKFDHVSIFLLIAGTYTLVFVVGLDGGWRITMLALVWSLAGDDSVLERRAFVCFRPCCAVCGARVDRSGAVLQTGAGALPTGAIALMVGGSITYTIGAVIYGTKN